MEQLLCEVVATGDVFCDKKNTSWQLMSQVWVEDSTLTYLHSISN